MGFMDRMLAKGASKAAAQRQGGGPPGPAMPVMPLAPVHAPAMSMFNASQFKQHLKIGKTRAKVQQQKAQNTALKTRQAVVEELRQNKNPTAYIKMEQYLRDTAHTEAFDVLEAYIELLIARVHLVASTNDFNALNDDVKEAIASLVFAAGRFNNAELNQATAQLTAQYTASIIDPLKTGSGPNAHCIDNLLAQKLEGSTPDGCVILDGLVQVAAEEGLDWQPGSAEPEDLRKPARSVPGHAGVGGFGVPPNTSYVATNVPGASAPPLQPGSGFGGYGGNDDFGRGAPPPPPPPGDDDSFGSFPPPPPPPPGGLAPP